jgi:glycosyltransferase involved in cell wall biosynthesis
VATGKLFEYLAADAPILVLGEDTEAARIVRETGAGPVTSATDPALIAAALAELVAHPIRMGDASAVAAYAYPEVARRYRELIEALQAARTSTY